MEQTIQEKFFNYKVEDKIELIEKFHKDKLKLIIDNFDELYDKIGKFRDFTNGYKKIEQKARNKTILETLYRKKKVTYKPSSSSKDGRLFGAGSLQGINKIVRHTLCKDICFDYDIKNAHNVFLTNYCDWNGISYKNLKYYNDNRDDLLIELMDAYNLEKDDAKKIVLTLINGGGADYLNSKNAPDWLYNLKTEIDLILKKVCELNPKLYSSIKKKKEWNPEGTTLNHILCKMENIVIQVFKKWCEINEIEINTICFDGLLLMNKIDTQDVEDYIKNELNIEVQIVEKEMNEGIELNSYEDFKKENVKEEYDYSKADFLIDKLNEEVDFQDFYSYNKFVNKTGDLEAIEDLFKNTIFYYEGGGKNPCYITKTKEWNESFKKFTYELNTNVSYKSLADIFRCIVYVKNNEKGRKYFDEKQQKKYKDDPFLSILMIDILDNLKLTGRLTKFQNFVFEPYFLKEPSYIKNKLNLFNKFELIEDNKWFDTKTNFFEGSHIHNHLCYYLCDNNPEIYNYVLDFIAHIIQKPNEKPDQVLLFKSAQGDFKDGLFEFITKMIGVKYSIDFLSIDNFFNNFNFEQEAKLITLINEVCEGGFGSESFKRHNEYKGRITGKTLRIEKKGIDAYTINSYSRYINFTNFDRSMLIENTDRRFVMIKSNSEKAGDTIYFKPLFDSLEDIDFIKSAFSFFAHRDISLFNSHKGPNTAFKDESKLSSLNNSLTFIKDLWDFRDFDDNFRIHTSALFTLFDRAYRREYGLSSGIKRVTFKSQLNAIGLIERNSKFKYSEIDLGVDGDRTKLYKILQREDINILGFMSGYDISKDKIKGLLEKYLRISNLDI
jgi:hypothetical protein